MALAAGRFCGLRPPRVRAGDSPDMAFLQRNTKLLREFGEDYNERKLE